MAVPAPLRTPATCRNALTHRHCRPKALFICKRSRSVDHWRKPEVRAPPSGPPAGLSPSGAVDDSGQIPCLAGFMAKAGQRGHPQPKGPSQAQPRTRRRDAAGIGGARQQAAGFGTKPGQRGDGMTQRGGAGQPGQAATGQRRRMGAASGHLYWHVEEDGTINVANLDGSSPTVLVTGQRGATAVAVSSGHLYWTNTGNGTITRANHDGSNPQVIVTGSLSYGLAVDASHLYWADIGAESINVANLDGTNPQGVVTDQNRPWGLAVDASHLYWTNAGDGTVNRANLDGSDAHALITGQGQDKPDRRSSRPHPSVLGQLRQRGGRHDQPREPGRHQPPGPRRRPEPPGRGGGHPCLPVLGQSRRRHR